MNDEQITDLAKHFMEEWTTNLSKKKKVRIIYILDIDSIDGVKMEYTGIEMNKHVLHLNLDICFDFDDDGDSFKNIESFNEYYYYGDDMEMKTEPTYENLRLQLIKVITTLENLKADTLNGRFTDKPIEDNKLKMTMSSLGKCKTIINECCVCLDDTKTQFSNCGHYCCIRCITNLKTTQTCCGNCCDGDCNIFITCPLCRATINVV